MFRFPLVVMAFRQIALVSATTNAGQPRDASSTTKSIAARDRNGFEVTKLSAYHVTSADIEASITDCSPDPVILNFNPTSKGIWY